MISDIDVVVPCYRYAHYLQECVQSILTQDGVRVRVLIIDDASPDNTAEIADVLTRGDARVSFVRHIANKGHIATYNEGIEWASADYFLLLSADDYLLPGALRRATDLMDGHPEVGFSFGRAKTLGESGTLSQGKSVFDGGDERGWRILDGLEFIKYSGANCIVPTPTVVVRTELQKHLGGYRPELPHSGDLEMWFRLAARAPVAFLESFQAVYRVHSANMTREYSQRGWLPDLEQRRAALEYFFEECNDTLPECQELRRNLLESLATVAVGFASSAFNDRQAETSRTLSDFALDVWPEVRRSWAWRRLALKRQIGSRVWNTLQPVLNNVKRTF